VVLSYYHASLVCRYLEENYGFAAIDEMLQLYAKGKQTTEVLPAVTGKDMKTLNGEVLAYVKRYAAQIKIFAPVDKNELARLDEQLRADPDNAKLLVRLAAGQLANRQLDAARDSARRAIQRDPKIARAHGILGYIAYEIDEDFRQARKHFLAAKAADPDYFYARLHLGLLAHKSGSAEEAITELEAARKLYPRFPSRDKNPHFLLAELYENAGKIDRAIAVMRDWVRVNNASYEGFKRLAELLAQSRKERHAEAAAAYLEAIYINPFEADIHLAAGKEYEAAGEHTEAAREYGVAVALDSKSLEALVGRARALAAAGDTRAARRAIVAIRDLDPENAEATKIESRLK
jgi:tetratricopeptide (TPR) repeat protein